MPSHLHMKRAEFLHTCEFPDEMQTRKVYLPSVDRIWPLSSERARQAHQSCCPLVASKPKRAENRPTTQVYGFKPMPLDDVLRVCVDFFEMGCAARSDAGNLRLFASAGHCSEVKFPEEAKKAALKLPSEPAATALQILEHSTR